MLVLDNNGKLFDDRRKEERRKENVKVDVERRQAERRTNTDNTKHTEDVETPSSDEMSEEASNNQ